MRISKPRDATGTIYVQVRDAETGKTVSKTYYEGNADEVFALIDGACEDAPQPEHEIVKA